MSLSRQRQMELDIAERKFVKTKKLHALPTADLTVILGASATKICGWRNEHNIPIPPSKNDKYRAECRERLLADPDIDWQYKVLKIPRYCIANRLNISTQLIKDILSAEGFEFEESTHVRRPALPKSVTKTARLLRTWGRTPQLAKLVEALKCAA